MSIKGIPLFYACKSSLSHLGLATTHILPIFPSSHRVLTSDSPHSKGPFQESSAISFGHVLRCLHYPVAAKTCQQYWGSTRFKNCSIFRQPIYSPSFLPSILPSILPSSLSLPRTPSTSPSSHLPHWKQIDTHKETADMSGGRRQHEEHSISRKVDIEGPRRIDREAYINQTNTPCSPLPPLAPPIQRIPSSKPVWDVARRGDCRGISFPSFSNLIFIIMFLYLISFLFFSFLSFSFLFFFLYCFDWLFCS